jgi:tetratricopeptide (TPR) repeat protein/NAD-dependent dihydropyrimidine dehydrogenase PreA subunit
MAQLQQIANRPLGASKNRGKIAPPAKDCGPVRPSKRGRWRALSLLLVYAAAAIHVAHWLATGSTLTPVEPSEAMQTLGSKALLNAGFIFFVLVIGSTLVFGRFFCGWACHVVALQDVCTWILRKLKIQVKPFRSRLLIFVPLLAAIYMFVLPTVARLVSGGSRDPLRAHFTTEDFWDRFPSWPIALLTFAVCGFLVVYLLGNKGFCTYGCPYGGIFGVVDQLTPGKIRVTDACEGCGHCTATCTSNVRVHEEVRTFGMVVDPGCMKCMDCVNVCPKDALYYGFGVPAFAKGRPRSEPRPRPFDFTWSEELGMAAIFAGSVVVLAGLYDRVPMLLALGLAGISAYVLLTAARMAYVPNLRFSRHLLRRDRKATRSGRVFVCVAALWAVFLIDAGATKWMIFEGTDAVGAGDARRGIELLTSGLRLSLLPMGRIEAGIADAHEVLGEPEQAEKHYALAVALAPRYTDGRVKLARYMAARGARIEAIDQLREAVRIDPETPQAAGDLAELLLAAGRGDEAEFVLAGLLRRRPYDTDIRLAYGVVLAHLDRIDESLVQIAQVTAARPTFADAYFKRAQILAARSRFQEALDDATRAVALVPGFVPPRMLAAQLAARLGQNELARRQLEGAVSSTPFDGKLVAIWARSVTRMGDLDRTLAAAEGVPESDLAARFKLLYLYREAGRGEDAARLAADLKARGAPLEADGS